MLFLFYNKNGALVGASKVSVATKTPGQTYRLTVPVKVLPGHAADDATPAQLVAIANPPFNYDKFLVSMKSLTDIKLKLSEVATSSMAGPQYMMSSSTYYEDGKATFATKVSRSDFHTMQADADASANPIEIDLERIVARVDTRFRSNWGIVGCQQRYILLERSERSERQRPERPARSDARQLGHKRAG